MPIKTGKFEEEPSGMLGKFIGGAFKVAGGVAGLVVGVGAKAVDVAGDAIDTAKEDSLLRKKAKKLNEENEHRLNESAAMYSETEIILKEEARRLDEIANKIIKDYKIIDSTILNGVAATKITEKDWKNFAELNFSGAMFGAVAGGAAAAGGATALVTAFCTAGTGAAISSLSGIFAVKATLAALGGGTLAAGGFGMAGGIMALGGLFAFPALAIGAVLAHDKIQKEWENVKNAKIAVDEIVKKNSELAEKNKLACNNFRQMYDLGVAIDFFLKNLQYRVEVAPEKIKTDMKKISKVAKDKLVKKFVEIKPLTDDDMNISDALEDTLQEIENECRTLQNLLNSHGKIYNSQEITPIFQQIYSDAEEYIYMSYPWFNNFFIKKDLNLMNQAVGRGVKFYIYYGFGNDDRLQDTVKAINWLKSQLNAPNSVKFFHVNSHVKAVLCEKYVLQGSQNMMSYRYNENRNDKREEVTFKIEDIDTVNELRELILSQKEI